jgi:hypothetical protein
MNLINLNESWCILNKLLPLLKIITKKFFIKIDKYIINILIYHLNGKSK